MLEERTQRKQISDLRSISGVQLVNQSEIKKEIINFYKDLMGTAAQLLPAVNTLVMRRGPQLQLQQRKDLTAPVTETAICDSLNATGDDKAPGLDGYNAVFFKNYGPSLKEMCWKQSKISLLPTRCLNLLTAKQLL